MFQKKFARELIALFILLGFSLSPSIATAQKKEKSEKKAERAASAQGAPVLWREPTDIASLDLFFGRGFAVAFQLAALIPELHRETDDLVSGFF